MHAFSKADVKCQREKEARLDPPTSDLQNPPPTLRPSLTSAPVCFHQKAGIYDNAQRGQGKEAFLQLRYSTLEKDKKVGICRRAKTEQPV